MARRESRPSFSLSLKAHQTVLVTGANRGIGFSIVQALALRNPTATYILACRTDSSGHSAVSELQRLGVKAYLDVVELDITNDSSIEDAAVFIDRKYGKLDILINNAGVATFSKSDSLEDTRDNFNTTLNTNVTSIAALINTFLPLLHKSPSPKVINLSSRRASLTRTVEGTMPPTAVVSYNVSKAAMNMLTVEMQMQERKLDVKEGEEGRGKIRFWLANPGHCKTAFNGFRGHKDPLDGAEVVVRLALEGEKFGKGIFWEFEEGEMRQLPW